MYVYALRKDKPVCLMKARDVQVSLYLISRLLLVLQEGLLGEQ